MAIKDWIAEQLLSTDVVQSAIKEAYYAGVGDGNDEPPPSFFGSHGYVAGHRRSRNRDLEAVTQVEAMELSYRLWQRHPMAKRIIEIGTDFVVGEGFQPECSHPQVQAVCEAFWNHPINSFDLKLPAKVRELALFGEQLYEVFTNDNGVAVMGAIDPVEIDAIVCDPENVENKLGVLLRGKSGAGGRLLRIVSADDDPSEMETECVGVPLREAKRMNKAGRAKLVVEADDRIERAYDGKCFFYNVNGMTTGTRGRPDLLPLTDWLDLLDQILFDLTERASLLSAFVYHVTMVGGKETEVRARSKELGSNQPKSGSVIVTNEKETWTAITPNLGAQDVDQFTRILRVFIAGGAGYPEAWFGEGSQTNRATLAGQNTPTLKSLSSRQKYVVFMLEDMLTYVVRQAVNSGRLPEMLPVLDDDGKATGKMVPAVDMVSVAVPDMDTKDMQQSAAVLQQVTSSLLGLINQGLMTQKVAVRTLAMVLAQLGIELDVDAMLKELHADEDYANMQQMIRQRERDVNQPVDSGDDQEPQDDETGA